MLSQYADTTAIVTHVRNEIPSKDDERVLRFRRFESISSRIPASAEIRSRSPELSEDFVCLAFRDFNIQDTIYASLYQVYIAEVGVTIANGRDIMRESGNGIFHPHI